MEGGEGSGAVGGMQAQVQARLQVQVHEFSLCSRVVQVGGVQVQV